jgi:hypothetical protein
MKKIFIGVLIVFGVLIFYVGGTVQAWTEALNHYGDYAGTAGFKAEIVNGLSLKIVPQKSINKAIISGYRDWELKVVISAEVVKPGKTKIVCVDKKREKSIYLVDSSYGHENYFADFWPPKKGIYKVCLVRPSHWYEKNIEPKMAFYPDFLWVGNLDTKKTPVKFLERDYK